MTPNPSDWWAAEPSVGGVVDAFRIDVAGHMACKRETVDRIFDCEGFGLVLSGSGFFRVGSGRRVELRAPAVFYVWPGIRFRYGPEPGGAWEERYLCFSGPRLREWARWKWLERPEKPRLLAGTGRLEELHQRIGQGLRSGIPARIDEAKLDAERLVWMVARATQGADMTDDPIVRLAESWRKSVPLALDLRRTAADLGLSYSSFRSRFQLATGMPPYQYILRLRIDAAARLLVEADHPIKRLAAETGFTHVESFCRAFSRFKRMSPGRFRRRFLDMHDAPR